MFLHTRILTQGWFRHKSVDLVRAFLTIGVVCLKKGDAGPGGENPPAPQALTAPGGMTPENATLPVAETHRRIDELYGDNDARDLSKETASIFLFSYGEYVASCSELDYKPFVERAENLTKSHYLLFDRQPGRRRRTPRIIRREWFCATHPDIAVVHIYLRE
jgi:hypothetical protein